MALQTKVSRTKAWPYRPRFAEQRHGPTYQGEQNRGMALQSKVSMAWAMGMGLQTKVSKI